MKKYRYILGVLSFLLLLLAFWGFFLRNERENRLKEKGSVLIEKIELFRLEHKRLPNTLEEMGIEERDGIDELYYDKRDSSNYTISFGTSLGESEFYYSDTKQWEDRYREIK
jgi:hypothetical protein